VPSPVGAAVTGQCGDEASGAGALVGDFVDFCGFANTGAIIAHKNDPPEVLESLINDLEAQLGTRYN
jgi:hypothetical protein